MFPVQQAIAAGFEAGCRPVENRVCGKPLRKGSLAVDLESGRDSKQLRIPVDGVFTCIYSLARSFPEQVIGLHHCLLRATAEVRRTATLARSKEVRAAARSEECDLGFAGS